LWAKKKKTAALTDCKTKRLSFDGEKKQVADGNGGRKKKKGVLFYPGEKKKKGVAMSKKPYAGRKMSPSAPYQGKEKSLLERS